METQLGDRKGDHLAICAQDDVGFRAATTLLDDVLFVHDALPELHADEIDLRTTLLGKPLRAPIVIAAMTGGTAEAERINRSLAAIAESRGYAFGLGSQRAMMKRPGVASTFRVRDVAPSTLVLGNIGGVQATKMTTEAIRALLDDVGADALCVHLNPAMELVQPEGDRDFRGVVATLQRLVEALGRPVVAKETGCGIGPATAAKLRAVGVEHVDVSGAGGTSWVAVETKRAAGRDEVKRRLGEALWDWGVPTAVSTIACAAAGFTTVIATGGVSTGLDVARSIALGASSAGIARPLLRALREGSVDVGEDAARAYLDGVEAELRAVMLLLGAADLGALRRVPRVVGPSLERWARALHIE